MRQRQLAALDEPDVAVEQQVEVEACAARSDTGARRPASASIACSACSELERRERGAQPGDRIEVVAAAGIQRRRLGRARSAPRAGVPGSARARRTRTRRSRAAIAEVGAEADEGLLVLRTHRPASGRDVDGRPRSGGGGGGGACAALGLRSGRGSSSAALPSPSGVARRSRGRLGGRCRRPEPPAAAAGTRRTRRGPPRGSRTVSSIR